MWGARLPSLGCEPGGEVCDAIPTVTFPAVGHHRCLTGIELYRDRDTCEQVVQGCCLKVEWPEIEPRPLSHKSSALTDYKQWMYTHTTVLRPFVRVHPGEPVPEETSIHSYPSCSSTILIIFLHLPRIIASSLLNPRTWQSLCSTSNYVLCKQQWMYLR